ncbi:hypothetical protein MTO96_039270 [Rhipicephalus appendiculatus]
MARSPGRVIALRRLGSRRSRDGHKLGYWQYREAISQPFCHSCSLMPKRMATASTGCHAIGPMTRDRRSRHALEPPLLQLREWQMPCQLCRLRRLACRRQTASTRLKSVRCSELWAFRYLLSALRLAARKLRWWRSGTGWFSSTLHWMVASCAAATGGSLGPPESLGAAAGKLASRLWCTSWSFGSSLPPV